MVVGQIVWEGIKVMVMLIASGSRQQSYLPFCVAKAIRVLIIDDHRVFRNGLRILLESQDRITDVGEASKAANALATIIDERPDIILS
jgi:PleD family two-component response regulator